MGIFFMMCIAFCLSEGIIFMYFKFLVSIMDSPSDTWLLSHKDRDRFEMARSTLSMRGSEFARHVVSVSIWIFNNVYLKNLSTAVVVPGSSFLGSFSFFYFLEMESQFHYLDEAKCVLDDGGDLSQMALYFGVDKTMLMRHLVKSGLDLYYDVYLRGSYLVMYDGKRSLGIIDTF